MRGQAAQPSAGEHAVAAPIEDMGAARRRRARGKASAPPDITARPPLADDTRLVLATLAEGVVIVEANGRIASANARAGQLLGRSEAPEALVGLDLAEDFGIHDAQIGRARQHGHAILARGGASLAISVADRAAGGLIVIIRDVTEQSRLYDQLKRARAEYSSLFENSVVGIYRSSLDGRQLRANPAYVRMNGYGSEDELLAGIGSIAKEWYVQPNRREEFVSLVHRDGMVTDFISEVYRHKTREKMWVSETGWLVRDEFGTPLYYEGTIIDATQRVEADAEIAHMAHFDPLTGLPNRLLFTKRVNALSRGFAAGTVTGLAAVLWLDLDYFKEINDTLGHAAGDLLLKLAGERLRDAVRVQDVVARLGGDEFAILLSEVSGMEEVSAVAKRIVATLSMPFHLGHQEAVVGASIGVALAPDHGCDSDELLRNADIALYRAKSSGRRTFSLFDPSMNVALQERRAIEVDLRAALANNELDLHLQPIVDLESGRVACMEALVRWNHPVRGSVPPMQFIPVAEEAGLIQPIGDWVLNRACAYLARLPGHMSVAINLSPVQFRLTGLVAAVERALKAHEVAPSRLEVEITESVLMVDDPLTRESVQALRAMGVRLALDDFGTGFSSLSNLQKFRFDKIKIDRTFASGVHANPVNAALVRAIVTLGRDLGIEVIAEGVETAEQLSALYAEGCRWFQGYYFGRPAPLADAVLTLAPHHMKS